MFNIYLIAAQTFDCGSIGSDLRPTRLQPRRLSPALYLNTADPATCRGNVTRWKYCYYPSQSDSDELPRIQFAVYRRNETGGGYVRVSNVFTAFAADDIDASFDCRMISLQRSQFVEVKTGDVIGVCILSQSLDVVSTRTGESLMAAGTCGFNSLPVSADTFGMSTMDGLLLHVYADEIFQTLISEQW